MNNIATTIPFILGYLASVFVAALAMVGYCAATGEDPLYSTDDKDDKEFVVRSLFWPLFLVSWTVSCVIIALRLFCWDITAAIWDKDYKRPPR